MVVYVHIGSPKSGTTYLQDLLSRNRSKLAQNGILWPGPTWRDQAYAVRDLLDAKQHGHQPPEVDGAWQRLLDEVHAWRGHAVVISMERLVSARPPHIRRAVQSLAPHDVRVVLTARDVARTVPAQWQESLQNWETWTWEEYLADVTAENPHQTVAGRRFFVQHDVGRILRTWGGVVPIDHMRVVTVPPSGCDPGLLWERFAQAIGIDPADYDTRGGGGNSSLGAASAEVMRRVNVATQERGLTWGEGDRTLKWALAKNTLSRRSRDEPRVTLPAEHHDWAEWQAKRLVADIEHLGVPIVGDLEDLIPGSPGDTVETVTPELLADAAIDGIAGMAQRMGRELERLRRELHTARGERDDALGAREDARQAMRQEYRERPAVERVERLRREVDVARHDRDQALRARDQAREIAREHRELPPAERVKRCLVELSEQVGAVRALLAAYRKVRGLSRRS